MKKYAWSKLKYMNPTEYLLGIDKVFNDSGIKKYKNASDILLDRHIRDVAEDRRCAIFCHGAGQALGAEIVFSSYENADYDYVGAYKKDGRFHPFPIQLKQVVPDRLNSSTSLQKEIDKLSKYVDSEDLTVAIHVNRKIHIKPLELGVTDVKVKEIWLFAKLYNESNTWILYGNLMAANSDVYAFQLPDT